jgi:threonine/homoserine/homoserine lactone efflux protein
VNGSGYAPLVVQGLLLGWSVAWPPGPVNAEMIRRGLTLGFLSAVAVGAGALGAGALADLPGVRPALGVISLALLLFLAWSFLSGAWRTWRRHGRGGPAAALGRLDTARGGFLLGLTMALSSPWNIAFWLAVIGQQAGSTLTLDRSFVLAGAVVVAAMLWTLVLCTGVQLGARFATPTWEILTRAATGVLMLFFAARLALRLAAAAG